MKNIVSYSVRIGISAGVLLFLFYNFRDQADGILSTAAHIPPRMLFLALGLFFFVNALLGLRLHYLFLGQRIDLGKLECLRLTFIGAFFNNFLPTGAGGDVVKGYLAAKKTQKTGGTIISIIMDRVMGLGMIFILASLSGAILAHSPIQVPHPVLKASYFLLVMLIVLASLLLFPPLYSGFRRLAFSIPLKKLGPYLTKMFKTIDLYRGQKPILLKALVISFFTQLTFAAVIDTLSRGLGSALPLFHLLVLLPLIHVAAMIPSINGLGVREGALVYLLSPTMGSERAAALALLSTGIVIFWGLFVGGALYVFFLLRGEKNDSEGTAGDFGLSGLREAPRSEGKPVNL